MCRSFYLNSLLVDPQSGEISYEGHTQVVEPKTMALLITLCHSPKKIISAESLFATVWPRSVYSPNLVRRNIALLRKLLNDSDKTLLKTHPKRGYSLQAEIKSIEDNEHIHEDVCETKTDKSFNPFSILLVVSVLALITLVSIYTSLSNNKPVALSHFTPITASESLEKYMRISPDGRYMAMVIGRSNTPENNQLVLRDLNTGDTQLLTDKALPYRYLAWQASDNSLVYSYPKSNGIQFGKITFDSAMRANSNKSLFHRGDISWNSSFFIDDQNQLFYLASYNNTEYSRGKTLFRQSIDTQEIVNLLPANEQFKTYKLALSKDKTHLALLGFNQQSTTQLKLFDLASGTLSDVRDLDNNWYFLTWFDSDSLILSNGRTLSQVSLSGNWHQLNKSSLHFLHYAQVNENTLYYIEKQVNQDIWQAPFDNLGAAKALVDTNTITWGEQLSADATQLAFISHQSGFPQLMVKKLATGKTQVVFNNDNKGLALSPPIWQNNNQYIASAINNRPFIIDINDKDHAIQWLDAIVGLPTIWLNQRNAFIYIDKSSQGDKAYIYDVKTNTRRALGAHGQVKQWALNKQDHAIANRGDKLINTATGQILLSIIEANLDIFSHTNGIYYRNKQQGEYTLGYLPFDGEETIEQSVLDDICSRFCHSLSSITDSSLIFSTRQEHSDILSFKIEAAK